MELSQLSVTYDRENDRILTRFNSQEGHELRVWLTRRLLSRAHQPLLDAMVNQDARQSNLASDDAASKRRFVKANRWKLPTSKPRTTRRQKLIHWERLHCW